MAKIKVFEPAPDPPISPKERKQHFSGKDKPTAFERLFPCQWRGISFPISSMRVTLSQDLAEHRYWGRDAANVESTGRAPLEIEATIPFVNGIVAGKNERWGDLPLYPTVFFKFLEAFNDRTTGILDTPEIAGLTCKPVSVEFSHDAQRRDGVEVTARWVETVDLDLDSDVRTAPLGGAVAAKNLDAAVAAQKDFTNPVSDTSFEELVNALSGAIDTTASKISLLLRKPDQILYRINKVQESIDRAKNVLLWPITEAGEALKEVLKPTEVTGTRPITEATSARPSPRPVGRQKLSTRTTLGMLQGLFPTNTVDDLIYLNPRLIARPTVPAGTVIRFYK